MERKKRAVILFPGKWALLTRIVEESRLVEAWQVRRTLKG
jgi:hypothetical protein